MSALSPPVRDGGMEAFLSASINTAKKGKRLMRAPNSHISTNVPTFDGMDEGTFYERARATYRNMTPAQKAYWVQRATGADVAMPTKAGPGNSEPAAGTPPPATATDSGQSLSPPPSAAPGAFTAQERATGEGFGQSAAWARRQADLYKYGNDPAGTQKIPGARSKVNYGEPGKWVTRDEYVVGKQQGAAPAAAPVSPAPTLAPPQVAGTGALVPSTRSPVTGNVVTTFNTATGKFEPNLSRPAPAPAAGTPPPATATASGQSLPAPAAGKPLLPSQPPLATATPGALSRAAQTMDRTWNAGTDAATRAVAKGRASGVLAPPAPAGGRATVGILPSQPPLATATPGALSRAAQTMDRTWNAGTDAATRAVAKGRASGVRFAAN